MEADSLVRAAGFCSRNRARCQCVVDDGVKKDSDSPVLNRKNKTAGERTVRDGSPSYVFRLALVYSRDAD